jgi:hypothetical protein
MICAFIPLGIWSTYEYGHSIHEIYKDYKGKPHFLSHLHEIMHEGTFKIFKAVTVATLSNELLGIAFIVTACFAMIFPEVFAVSLLEASIALGISVGVYLFNQLIKLLGSYYLTLCYKEEKKI